jgi:hypothetical protein
MELGYDGQALRNPENQSDPNYDKQRAYVLFSL